MKSQLISNKSNSRKRSRVFLNCNIDPPFYYKNLKALCLLFDEIVVWNPSEKELLQSSLKDSEIIDGFIGTGNEAPLLIPGGRVGYFSGAREGKGEVSAFRKAIKPTAEHYGTILPEANRPRLIDYVNSFDRKYDSDFKKLSSAITLDASKRDLELEEKLVWLYKNFTSSTITPERAFFAEFLLDMDACSMLDSTNPRVSSNTFPLINDRFAEGYRIVQSVINKSATIQRDINDINVSKDPTIDANYHQGRTRKLIEGIADVFQVNNLPWSEVRNLRNASSDLLNDYFQLNFFSQSSKIDDRLSKIAISQKLYYQSISIAKILFSNLRKVAQYHVTPETATYDEFLSDLKKQMDAVCLNSSKMLDQLPMITRHIVSAAGQQPAELAGDVAKFGCFFFSIDEKLSNILLRSSFRFAKFSRIALLANDSRELTYSLEEATDADH